MIQFRIFGYLICEKYKFVTIRVKENTMHIVIIKLFGTQYKVFGTKLKLNEVEMMYMFNLRF